MLPSEKCYKSNAKNLWKLITLKMMNADLPSLLCHSPSVEWVAWGRWLMNKSLFLNNVKSESGLRLCSSSLNLFPRESFVWVNKQNSICVYLKTMRCGTALQLLSAPGNDDKQVALFQVALDHLVHVLPRHLALLRVLLGEQTWALSLQWQCGCTNLFLNWGMVSTHRDNSPLLSQSWSVK